ncbi:MAG: BamA/TamA family outer membrane protein [Ignavibacteriales bacterium]|nr:BamA/TamA family outer membrane protein [Ignavibacteriales bacterium]
MKLIIVCLILFLCSSGVVFGQTSPDRQDKLPAIPDSIFVVDSIFIFGNSHTKSFVILREMSLQSGSIITKDLIIYDQNRIYSLGLFNRVEIGVQPTTDGKASLMVEVDERWYVFPFPMFGIKDRDWKKLYYGAGLLHSNFRGRNEKLYGVFVFGYDPSGEIWYRNPFLSADGSYNLDAKIAYSKNNNKSVSALQTGNNFKEEHIYATLGLGKRFGLYHQLWLTTGYENVKVSEYQPSRTISTNGEDDFPFLGLSYTYDTRDLVEYPSKGSFVRLATTKYGIPGNKIDVVRYATDIRQFVPLDSKFVFSARLFTNNVAAGPTPSYNRVFFGYTERIRGHFKEIIEGENLFGFSSELHYKFFEPVFIRMDFLPQQFSVLKFGINAALFADAGTVWFRNEQFALDRFIKGYGFGLHFLLPYSIVLRTDYAWNESRRGEFILDLGSSF